MSVVRMDRAGGPKAASLFALWWRRRARLSVLGLQQTPDVVRAQHDLRGPHRVGGDVVGVVVEGESVVAERKVVRQNEGIVLESESRVLQGRALGDAPDLAETRLRESDRLGESFFLQKVRQDLRGAGPRIEVEVVDGREAMGAAEVRPLREAEAQEVSGTPQNERFPLEKPALLRFGHGRLERGVFRKESRHESVHARRRLLLMEGRLEEGVYGRGDGLDGRTDGGFDDTRVVEADVRATLASRDAVLVRHLPGLHLEREDRRRRSRLPLGGARTAGGDEREYGQGKTHGLGLHPLVLRSGPSLARSPAGAEDVGGLAVDAVRGAHHELAVLLLVDPGGARVDVEPLGFEGEVFSDE